MTRAALGNFSKGTTPFKGAYGSNNVANPYSMPTRDGEENINWLL
jgi:hypothetical protein